ncbi:MAG: DUF4124 domain-containing protein [Synechococcaceae cyanobacterium SM1_2_3]|nr:DUF4124 domain-containing protein [Synechococcaceae cyanobacterium SM1_2_3]
MLIAIIVFAVLGGLLFYVYAKPQVVPAWAREWLPGLPKYTLPLYRWRDEQGRVQITDQPPQNRPFEEVQYRADANVVPPRSASQ